MSSVTPRTLVVLQPGYLPWLGLFDQMRRSDIFVLYDDVQFDKHGWRNRNRIKAPTGPRWLTVPVHIKEFGASILDVEIDNSQPWARKHIGTIQQFYTNAPYLHRYLPTLKELLEGHSWNRILDLDVALIKQMCNWLGLKRQLVQSSELNIQGKRSERLLNLCLYFQAGRYLSGNAARNYLDLDLFASHGVEVEWQDYQHPVYPQQHGEFVPYLSALDLLFNCGDESGAILAGSSKFQYWNSVAVR